MTNPGAPTTLYYLITNTPLGNRLRIVDDYISLEASRTAGGMGSLIFTVPGQSYTRDDFPADGVVELWRAPIGGSAALFLDTIWFIRARSKLINSGKTEWKITCYDTLYLLGSPANSAGRIIPYNEGNAYSEKLDQADDMCKAIIRENLGSLATDTTRSIATWLSVQADVGLGQLLRKEFSRRNVLATLQEIAQASTTAGTYLAFDIVCVSPPNETVTPAFTLQFRTYTGQRGVDRRASSGNPVLIGPDFGNMDEIELTEDWIEEHNFIYTLGQGVANITAVATSQDAARIAVSPFNRREFLVNSNTTGDATALQDESDSALRAGKPKTTLTAKLLNTRQLRFGVDWNWGDYLTAQTDGFAFDCRVETISVQVTQSGGESVTGQLKGEATID